MPSGVTPALFAACHSPLCTGNQRPDGVGGDGDRQVKGMCDPVRPRRRQADHHSLGIAHRPATVVWQHLDVQECERASFSGAALPA